MRAILCFFLGHRIVWPADGGAMCTRCRAATDWAAWLNGRSRDGEGAGWYDEEIYPGDTYPCLHRDWFGRLEGGVLAGPGWRKYETDEEADEDAIKAAPTGSASGPVGGDHGGE